MGHQVRRAHQGYGTVVIDPAAAMVESLGLQEKRLGSQMTGGSAEEKGRQDNADSIHSLGYYKG